MMGNGSFFNNKLTNYQGNTIGMWPFSRASTRATCFIHDSVCYKTRKYGGFELQSLDKYVYPGKSTFCNAKVYNNTVGNMNALRQWEGQSIRFIQYQRNTGVL
jgi:hypothetical protein